MIPAHSSGAASAAEMPSGTATSPLARVVMYSAYPPSMLTAGDRLVGAEDEVAAAAVRADQARAGVEADADPVADLPAGDAVADRVDPADDLVAGHDRRTGRQGAEQVVDAGHVAVADPAGLDRDPDLAGVGLGELLLDQGEHALESLHGAIRS